MFIRFTVNKIKSQSGVRQGILGAAFQLQRSGSLDAVTLGELSRALDWLKINLATLEIFDKPENLKGVAGSGLVSRISLTLSEASSQ